jgi:hypothetical protein
MNQLTDSLRHGKRLRVIASALELLHHERADSAAIAIPGTEPQQYVAIGTAATIAKLLEIDEPPTARSTAGQSVSAGIKPWSERMPAPWKEPVCSMNCSPPCTREERESCGDCAIVTRRGDPIKARDEEIAELRAKLAAFEGSKGDQA